MGTAAGDGDPSLADLSAQRAVEDAWVHHRHQGLHGGTQGVVVLDLGRRQAFAAVCQPTFSTKGHEF